MRGKLIEGTDCSGKETQSLLLGKKLNELGIETRVVDFPNYDSPTGRIFGACYLGKEEMCKNYLVSRDGWFSEGDSNVDPLVASLYVAADRRYNIKYINELLDDGINVILDRYVYSNMAHQGCKIADKVKRKDFIKKIELLEFDLLELPKPDFSVLLYMPVEKTIELKQRRKEKLDQHEICQDYLVKAENTYLELRNLYDMTKIECVKNNFVREIEDINKELLMVVLEFLKKKENKKCKSI